jgi:hypothetical protein
VIHDKKSGAPVSNLIRTNPGLSDVRDLRPALGIVKEVDTAIAEKRSALVGTATPEGFDLFTYLGDPLGASSPVAGGTIQRYLRGYIVARDKGGIFVVYGFVADAWARLGGATGFVALPNADQQVSAGGGSLASFDGADITWSNATGAHEIHGAIRDRWHALGGVAFGYPTTDESPLTNSAGAEIGRTNGFPNGAGLYWSAASGAWDCFGAIAAQWKTQDGGPGGLLGMPTSGETDTPDAGGRYSQFENGIIVWHPDGPFAGPFTVTNLRLVVTGFQSSFDDIHVGMNIDVTNPSLSSHTWVPSESDYTSDPVPSNPNILTVPTVTASTVLTVWMDGLGQHTFGKDERLGIVQHQYDITNLWGLVGENSSHGVTTDQNSDFSFSANYSLESNEPIDPTRPFRESSYWPFHNFVTPILSDQDYAATYTDIEEGESLIWHPFDRYFYDNTYKDSAAGGNCFGMCLSSLYATNRTSAFGEPIFDNPLLRYSANLANGGTPNQDPGSDDLRFTVPINIMHGYQFGAAAQDWYSQSQDNGLVTDPVRVFNESQRLHDSGELQMFIVRFGNQGHCVVPYQWEVDGNTRRVFVANCNAPWPIDHADANNDPQNIITIVTTGNDSTWSIDVGGGTIWSGGTSMGNEIYYLPFSMVSYKPERSGGGDIFGAATNSAMISIGGAETISVTEVGSEQVPAREGVFTAEFGIRGLVRLPRLSDRDRFTKADVSPIAIKAERVNPGVSQNPGISRQEFTSPIQQRGPVLLVDHGPEVYRLHRPLSMTTAKAALDHKLIARSIEDTATVRTTVDRAALMAETPTAQPAPPVASPSTPVASSQPVHRSFELSGGAADLAHGVAPKLIAGLSSNPQLRWELSSLDGTPSTWAMRSGSGSIATEVDGAPSHDIIELASALDGVPAVTLHSSDANVARTAKVTLVGPTMDAGVATRVITVSALALSATAGVTVQLIDNGNTVAISNAAGEAECSITIAAGLNDQSPATRSAIPLPAGVVTTITPSDWASGLSTQQLNLQHLSQLGGTVIQQSMI